MTYAREPDSFEAALDRVQALLTPARSADLAGCSPSRLRQCANPERPADVLKLSQAVALDLAASHAGAGCPHWEAMTAQLVAAGALAPGQMAPGLAARGEGLTAVLRHVLPLLRAGLDRLQAALDRNETGPAVAFL